LNAVVEETKLLKLDLGCGINKRAGFIGVDRRQFEGVDQVANLLGAWPWADESVEEINMSHVLEHFTGHERVRIFNEMHRVLVKGGKATITTPHWCSNRAYGDFTHMWPPVSEMLYFYVSRDWRLKNAPDNDITWNPEGYTCDFEATWGYSLHPDLLTKSQDRVGFSVTFYKEACQDLTATLTKK
jgi:SAM-dependent methyltransferase